MAAASLTLPPDVEEALQRLADHRRQAVDDVAVALLRQALLANPVPNGASVQELDRAAAEAGAVLASLAYREALQRAAALPSFTAEDLWLATAAHFGAVLPIPSLAESRAISNLGLDVPLDDDDMKALRSWIVRRKGAWPPAA
jgi:predicted transcriptional regulator